MIYENSESKPLKKKPIRISKDRVVLSDLPVLRTCTRMSLLGHMVLMLVAGVLMGYSISKPPLKPIPIFFYSSTYLYPFL